MGNPFLITLPNQFDDFDQDAFALNQNQFFPICKSRNASDNPWNDDECFVHDINEELNTITCGCIQLQTHMMITAESFTPSAVTVPSWKWRSISSQNFNEYPMVWMTIAIILVVFILLSGLQCTQ